MMRAFNKNLQPGFSTFNLQQQKYQWSNQISFKKIHIQSFPKSVGNVRRNIVHCGPQPLIGAWKTFSTMNEMRERNVDLSRQLNDCFQRRRFDEAEKAYNEEVQRGLKPNITTYTAMMKIFGRQGKAEELFRLLAEMKQNQNKADEQTYNSIIDLWGKRGETKDMFKLFLWMKQENIRRNKKTYNPMLEAFSKKGEVEDMVIAFNMMREERVRPDSDTYTMMIDAFGKQGNDTKMVEYFTQMKKEGVQPFIETFHALTNGYAFKGDLVNLDSILKQMKDHHFLDPDATIYAAMVETFLKNGKVKEALDIYAQMQAHQIAWTFKAARALLSNYEQNKVPTEALPLFKDMLDRFEKRNGDSVLATDDIKAFAGLIDTLKKNE